MQKWGNEMKPIVDIELYDFLEENHDSIFRDMVMVQLTHRNRQVNLPKEIPAIMFKAINSLLLDSSRFFHSHLKEWKAIIMERSFHLTTPISCFAESLRQYRHIYSRYIKQFIINQGKSINPERTCHWLILINEGFDRLLSQFIDQLESSKKQHAIHDISASVLPLAGQLGVLPLTAPIHADGLELDLKVVVDQCVHLKVNHLFIDLSGIAVIDSLIAEEISKLAKILSMLGISVTISGMKPEAALYTIQSGIDFSQFTTASTLKQALRNYGVQLAIE